MAIRERLIRFQNDAERDFQERKTLRNTLRYVLAFIVFMSSTLWAQITMPFRLLKKTVVRKKEIPGIVKMTGENIDTLLSERSLVLIDFWAEWCGPCIMMNPTLEAFALSNPDLCVAKVNADLNSAILKRFRVKGLPQFVLMQDGVEVKRHAGPMTSADLEIFCRT